MSVSFTATLDNGETVNVVAHLTGPEPDVGLFGYGIDYIEIFDEAGNEYAKDLTDSEDDRLGDEAINIANDRNRWPDPPPGDYD